VQSKEKAAQRKEAVLFYAGVAVLAVGLGVALAVFLAATDETEDVASIIAGSKLYQHNLQLMGGHFGALLAQFTEWFATLWHGRALAGTIAVIAVVLASVCFCASFLVRSGSSAGSRDH